MFQKQMIIEQPEYFKKLVPLSSDLVKVKSANDKLVIDTIANKNKYIIVCGPCSADDRIAVTEYCRQLKNLSDRVKDKILLIPRIYTVKPHSSGNGYLGILFHKNKYETPDIRNGIIECRKLFIKCIELGMPIADELLYSEQLNYFDDLVSYYFLGARSSEDPTHRNLASGLDIQVGIKNNTSGSIETLIQSVYAVSHSKYFCFNNNQVYTQGNKNVNIVLRGYKDSKGAFQSNFSDDKLDEISRECDKLGLQKPFIMVDCAHANSAKDIDVEISNALSVVKNRRVNGIMIESYLYGGVSDYEYGTSKTDPCLDWNTTERLIIDIYKLLP